MNLNSLVPLLRTHRLHETVDWYVNVLGFTCTDFVASHGFARVQLNGADIMLASANDHQPFDKPGFTGSFLH